MIDESGQSSGFGIVTQPEDTITKIKLVSLSRVFIHFVENPEDLYNPPSICRIRKWSHTPFDGGVEYVPASTLESLQRENAELRSALADLTSWFEDGVSIYGPWIIRSGEHGADAAVTAAQSALSSTGDTHGN